MARPKKLVEETKQKEQGIRAKKVRKNYLGMTQEQFAEYFNYAPETISCYERGTRTISDQFKDKITREFPWITKDYLNGESEYVGVEEEVFCLARTRIESEALVQDAIDTLMSIMGYKLLGYLGTIRHGDTDDPESYSETASFSLMSFAELRSTPDYIDETNNPNGIWFSPDYCIFQTPERKYGCPYKEYARVKATFINFVRTSMRSLFDPLWTYSRCDKALRIDMWNYNTSDRLVADYEKLLQKSHVKWIETPKNRSVSDK